MTWVKIDDQFFLNPKIAAAGPHGVALHLAGMCWTAGQLTDGQIPRHMLPTIAAQAGVTQRTVARLVAEGLWEETADGWTIHNWLKWNPSGDKVRAERAAAKERMNKRRGSPGVRPNDESTNGRSSASPSPSPSVPSEPHSGSRFADGQTRPHPPPFADLDLHIEPGARPMSDLRGVLRSIREDTA